MAAAQCAVCSRPLRTGYRVRGSAPRCLRHALLHPALLRRSLVTALVVGTILTTINQSDRILAGTVTWMVLLKIGLTYCVPFCVASYGALGASRVAIGTSATAAPTESSTSIAASSSSGLNPHGPSSPPR
ncbi:MAG: nitrate/nitrite transporter NrtS [Dehalococcoidia bacterium]